MLNYSRELAKYLFRKLSCYNRLKDYYTFKQYKKYYYANPNDYIVLNLPELSDYNSLTSTDLYPYYWFAENMQYFGFSLRQIEGVFSKQKLKVLYNSSFGTVTLKYDMDLYFKELIKSSERALIRKAVKNGYTCKQISYDDYIKDIVKINTSKYERQGKIMGDDYVHVVKRDEIVKKYNPFIYTFGCFTAGGELIAYYMFEKITNFIHVNKGIGHLDHLNMGVMNYLFAYSLCELSSLHNGLTMVYGVFDPNSSNGLFKFKKHVGCKRKTLVYQGNNKQYKVLNSFIHKYSLRGDSGLNYIRDYIIHHE